MGCGSCPRGGCLSDKVKTGWKNWGRLFDIEEIELSRVREEPPQRELMESKIIFLHCPRGEHYRGGGVDWE